MMDYGMDDKFPEFTETGERSSISTEFPGLDSDPLKSAVRALAADVSLELAPVAAAKVASFEAILPKKARVFIPVLPGTKAADNVPLAARLTYEGMTPVPHIAARRLTSVDELDDTLSRLKEQASVTEILLIAGDPERPNGPFPSTLEVFTSGLLQKYGITRAFVAGHPEPNPAIPTKVAEDYLLAKNAIARETGLSIEIATQFSFSAPTILAWEREMREAGNTLPIRVGLAGPSKPTTLLKFAAMCGVKASASFVAKSGLKLNKLAVERAPDDVIVGLAGERSIDPGSMIKGLHFFTFGGFAKCAGWVGKVAAGEFDFAKKRVGFSVRND